MKKEFVPYEPALALEELGFDEPCFATHGYLDLYIDADAGHIKAPTYRQAFRWFREKYKLHYSIDYECSQHDHKWGYNWSIYNYNLVIKTDDEYITSHPDAPSGEWVYDSYEEAELACLRKLIELVKS